MNSIEKEELNFFIILILIDLIVFYLSHYFTDLYLINKKNDYLIMKKDFLIKKEEIIIEKEIPTITIQHEINIPLKKDFEFHVEIDDDKKEEYDPIYLQYR